MRLSPFVDVVVPENCVAADFPEMETVVSSARVLLVLCLADGNNAVVFDNQPVRNCRVGGYPLAYVTFSVGMNLWIKSHGLPSQNT